MSDTHGGFAKGIPKNLVKFPSVEPMKSFELRDALMCMKWDS